MPKLLSLQGNALKTINLLLHAWFSLIQVEVDDDPAESKQDNQDDQAEVYLFFFSSS